MTTYTPPGTHGREWNWTHIRGLCLREARRVLGATAAADDAAQEAAIRAWRLRARCRTPTRPDPWIATIARNEALRILAQRRDQESLEQAASERSDDPLRELDLADVLDLRTALRAMDGQDKRLLVGRYWQDLENSELAEQLGVAEATVRVRLHRLRNQLRKTLVEA
jgi:RNA polymerase sigma-70 factor (ECF subfamily)